MERLAKAAKVYPQSVYSVFTQSLSCEWSYIQCVTDGCDGEYSQLGDVISNVFTSAVLGREVLQMEHTLFELPVKLGGLAFADP